MASRLRAKDPKAAEPSKPKVLIYGKPGVGKTWTSLDFPRCYYIDTEGGADLAHYTDKLANSGGAYLGPSDGACEFGVIIDQVKALATEQHPYQTLIIDSISKVFNSTVALEAERLQDKAVFGAEKKPAVRAMAQLVAWLQKIDMNVLLVAHSKAEWGKSEKGEREEIGETFDCWDKLEYELHLALRIVKQGPSRKAIVRKTRLLGFPEGQIFNWAYSDFADRYGRDVIEGKVTQIQLATPAQVADVLRLLETVRVDEDFTEKCFARAGAQAWTDLDTVQISKTIEFLRGKIAA